MNNCRILTMMMFGHSIFRRRMNDNGGDDQCNRDGNGVTRGRSPEAGQIMLRPVEWQNPGCPSRVK
jgi:hypothetical protein